jgi:hypothetical protein
MKRIRAGMYQLDHFYTYKDEAGFWTVGEIINESRQHIEDFRTYREARGFILEKLGAK